MKSLRYFSYMVFPILALVAAAGCRGHQSSAPAPAATAPAPAAQQSLALVPDEENSSVSASVSAANSSPTLGQSSALTNYETQLSYQRGLLLQEQKALDLALYSRDSSVHLGRDFLDVVAYGISTGYLTTDFLRRTGNLEGLREFLASSKRLAPVIPIDGRALDHHIVTPTETAVIADEATYAAVPEKVAIARQIGSVAFRATELASAVTLGFFFVGNVLDTGKDLVIRFKDTDDIKMHREKLAEANRNLATADQNLKAAIASEAAQ